MISLNPSAGLVLCHRSNYQEKGNYPHLDYSARIRSGIYLWRICPTHSHIYRSPHVKNPHLLKAESKNNTSLLLKVLIQTQTHLWFTECETTTLPTEQQKAKIDSCAFLSLWSPLRLNPKRELTKWMTALHLKKDGEVDNLLECFSLTAITTHVL